MVSQTEREEEREVKKGTIEVATTPFRRPPSATSGLFSVAPISHFHTKTLMFRSKKKGGGDCEMGKADVTLGQNDIHGGLFIPQPLFSESLILNGISIS